MKPNAARAKISITLSVAGAVVALILLFLNLWGWSMAVGVSANLCFIWSIVEDRAVDPRTNDPAWKLDKTS